MHERLRMAGLVSEREALAADRCCVLQRRRIAGSPWQWRSNGWHG